MIARTNSRYKGAVIRPLIRDAVTQKMTQRIARLTGNDRTNGGLGPLLRAEPDEAAYSLPISSRHTNNQRLKRLRASCFEATSAEVHTPRRHTGRT